MKFDSISKDFLVTAEKTNSNIFLTGVAGSGKSTLVNYFISKTNKKFILLGTTGIAAINIGGVTLHSFFGIKIDGNLRSLKRETIDYINKVNGFIIDEVSMMRSDLFDTLDYVLRKYTGIDKPFGGKQIIFVGDLLQLPPVLVQYRKNKEGVRVETDEYISFMGRYKGRFFFNAEGYKTANFKTINLKKVYRQNNEELINTLNLIRVGIQSEKLLTLFNKKVTKKLNPKAILIGSTNRIVSKYNEDKLAQNKNPKELLSAFIEGDFEKDDYPTERRINIKIDCRVMFTKNDKDGRYSNGTLGTITNIERNKIVIQKDDGIEIDLVRFTWKNVIGEDDFGEEIIAGSFSQFPIKLAHAITIHKSQGKTFDNVIIDTGWGCFEAGMMYVALSRVTSIDGLQLVKKLKISDIQSDINVKKFLEN